MSSFEEFEETELCEFCDTGTAALVDSTTVEPWRVVEEYYCEDCDTSYEKDRNSKQEQTNISKI